jgi:3-oxoacyl-[acyl-carrier-protein] synthase II
MLKKVASCSAIVTGIGYLANNSLGAVNTDLRADFKDTKDAYTIMRDRSILQESIKNFGRFSDESKLVCLAAGLALHDAGIAAGETPNDTGIIASNTDGALVSNREYFQDYIDCGRKLSRGNLFIYTLPTSSLAEAAICFHLNGPILYVASQEQSASFALREAAEIVKANGASMMVAVTGTQEEMICCVVKKKNERGKGTSSVEMARILDCEESTIMRLAGNGDPNES